MNPSNSSVGKSLPIASNPPSNQAGSSTSSIESRRPALTGPSNSTSSAPRKGQASRKQHKNQRRPATGDRSYTSPDAFDAMAEQRLLRNPNSRRGQMNITHLLDYQRFQPSYGHHDRPSHGSRDWRREQGSYMSHTRDRDRYVHANYRFIVSPNGTYTGQASDPDMKLSWDLILQIIASSVSQSSSCPICLSEPVAPRMVKCGHVFCLSCFLRFMASTHPSEKDGKTPRGPRCQACPICENDIYHRDARPVRFYAGQESSLPRPGDDVVLRLMARNANSILALPSEGGAEVINSGDDIPWHFAANVLDYARVMKATPDYMREQFDEEIAALEKQEKEDELMFGEDHEWTQKAIRNINTAKEKLSELGDVDTATVPGKGNRRPRASEADFHYYSSQPHLYLSPLDIRILKTKYGSFSQFPSTLLPRVENITTGHHVDDAMRKRAKYLGHLPRGCIVNFLECDWTDIIPEEILETLKVDIERRRRRNAERLSQEEKYRLHAERQEAAELRRTTGQRLPAVDLEDDRPPMDPSDFQPLTTPSGASPPESRVGFGTLAELSASPNAQRTVWGTAAPVYEGDHNDHQEEVWEDDPFNSQNIAAQLEAMRLQESVEASQETSGADGNGAGNGGGGKKKKKQKQKLTLMSTGGRRGM